MLELFLTGELEDRYFAEQPLPEGPKDVVSTTQPLFWFPAQVDGVVIRLTGVMTCLASVASILLYFFWYELVGKCIAYYLLLDFVLRFLGGSRFSPIGRVAMVLATSAKKQPRVGRPKQFASVCGISFSLLGSVFYAMPVPYSDYIGAAFIGMLGMATGMEGFLDFCLGCVFFRIFVHLGLFAKD